MGGGGRTVPNRRKVIAFQSVDSTSAALSAVTNTTATQPGVSISDQPRETSHVPQLVRAGLPFLWDEGPSVTGNSVLEPSPPRAVPEEQPVIPIQACQLYLEGKCPHGISGKSNGGCQRQHRKKCTKFMKWGNKGERGCKDPSCDKAHPKVCPRSLDLVCLLVDSGLHLEI